MSDNKLLVRMFLRAHPEFIPDVITDDDGEPVLNEAAFEGFKVWTAEMQSRLTLRELRQFRDFLNDPTRKEA